MPVLQPIIDRIARNETISRDEALAFASDPALRADLFDTAAEATKRFASRIFNICGIVSIKTVHSLDLFEHSDSSHFACQ